MNDELKDLFEKHGPSHEEEMPEGHLDRFADKLNKSNKIFWLTRNFKVAASVIVLVGLGYYLAKNSFDQPSGVNTEITAEENVTDNMDIYFSKKVSVKVQELKNLGVQDTSLITESLNELEVLEEEYAELKNKLAEVGNNKLIIKAMAKNYRTRLKLLDLLITRLEYNVDDLEQEPKTDSIIPRSI